MLHQSRRNVQRGTRTARLLVGAVLICGTVAGQESDNAADDSAGLAVPAETELDSVTVPVEHRYLGQAPPGEIPQVFARSFFPDYIHSTPVFSHDLSEMFWSDDDDLRCTSITDGEWTTRNIRLSERDFEYDSPFISPTGDRLLFMSHHPAIEGDAGQSENIWSAQRRGSEWKEPVALNSGINRHHMHWQLSVAANGSLYFVTDYTGKSALAMARFTDGHYEAPVVLDQNINNDAERQMGPYIAPDESYLLFTRAPDLTGSDEIYISFKKDGNWTKAEKIRLANGSTIHGILPVVSPDGQYLFFMGWTNRQHRAHWVSLSQIKPPIGPVSPE